MMRGTLTFTPKRLSLSLYTPSKKLTEKWRQESETRQRMAEEHTSEMIEAAGKVGE